MLYNSFQDNASNSLKNEKLGLFRGFAWVTKGVQISWNLILEEKGAKSLKIHYAFAGAFGKFSENFTGHWRGS
jgi:hypothetical protein